MINSDNFQKIPNRKLLRKNRKNSQFRKLVKNIEILELLGKGYYAQEIVQMGTVSKSFLSKIIRRFKKRDLVEQIQSYPKRYKLTNLGNFILSQGDLDQKRIPEFITNRKTLAEMLPPVRGHLARFKNELIQRPSWLSKIRKTGQLNGLIIKRVQLHNWEKFIVYFNYQDFNGLEKIEICKEKIIYNFKQKLGDQLVHSNEDLNQYENDLIFNCKQARTFLQKKGFIIGQEEPVRCQKPHYGIITKDPSHIGQLGKKVLMTIKTPNESIIIDDSPGIEGEEETDNIEKVRSYFALPHELDNVKKDVSNIKEKIDQMEADTIRKDLKSEFSDLKDKIIKITEGIKEGLKEGFEKMTQTIIKSIHQPEQSVPMKADSGGMFQ